MTTLRYTSLLTLPILVVSVSMPLGTNAAEEVEELVAASEFETMVVTGTRTQKPILDTPVRTEVISRQQLDDQHARDVKDALEMLPGVVLRAIHGKSGYEVWMQGFDSNRVKILIDGEPVATSTGSTVDVTQINSLEIEHIEIVKGAVSALYGSSAMGGVINIITRSVAEDFGYEAKLEGGSFGKDNLSEKQTDITSRLGSGSVQYGAEHYYARLGLTLRDSDGFDDTPDTWGSQGPEGTRSTGDLKLGWRPTDGQRYEFNGNYYEEDLRTRTATNAGGKYILQHKDEVAERTRLGLRAFWDQKNSQIKASIFNETFDNTTYQDVLATPEKENRRDSEHQRTKASIDGNWNAFENHLLSLGTEYYQEELSQVKDGVVEVPADTDHNSVELYVQDDIFLTDSLEILPGIRAQRDSDFGYHTAPKINGRYDFQVSTEWEGFFRGGLGMGYRVPNLKERYYIFDHSHLGYMVIGNADLSPEESTSYQAGFGLFRLSDAQLETSLDTNFFYNDTKDLIETVFNEPLTAVREDNVSIHSYLNIASARTYGAEISLSHQFSEDLYITAGYTWTRGEDESTGKDLPNRPEHQLKTTLRYAGNHAWLGKFNVILNHLYQSSEFVDLENRRKSGGYHMLDLKITVPVTSGLQFYTGIENLTDEQRDFADPDDQGPIEGRYIYLGLSLKG